MKALSAFKILVVGLLLFAGVWSCKNTSAVKDDNATAETQAREALYWARKDSAKMQFTQADVKFMTGMITHHAQALVMSRLIPSHASNESVKTLGKRIINSQTDEIALMQQWLRERDQPVPQVHIDGLDLTITGNEKIHPNMHMPGMLSQQQLNELDDTHGAAFDRLFLKYMIQHHTGALTMVDTLFSAEGAALEEAAFKLSSDINADQKTEIARMQRMLNRLQNQAK